MARGGWRRQPRDRRGRWTSVGAGVAKQTGGRGARLMSPGKQRDGGGRRISSGTGKPSGTVSGTKRGRSSDAAERAIKAASKRPSSQRQIATQMKKEARSKNVQATRILQKMAAKDGHGGDIKDLTQGRRNASNKWSRTNKGNNMAASRSKDLMFDHGPSKGLQNAALDAARRGVVPQKRVDRVFKAAGLDYMTTNKGYDRALSKAKAAQSKRRRRNRK